MGQNSALILAISSGDHWKLVRSLCINVEIIRFVVSFLGFDKVAELLIEKGADVHIVGQDGTTALTVASNKGKKHKKNSFKKVHPNAS